MHAPLRVSLSLTQMMLLLTGQSNTENQLLIFLGHYTRLSLGNGGFNSFRPIRFFQFHICTMHIKFLCLPDQSHIAYQLLH